MRHVLENWSGSRDSTWWRNWSTGIPAGNHPCRSPDLVLVGELELGFGETPANSESAFSPILYGNENGGSGSRNIQQCPNMQSGSVVADGYPDRVETDPAGKHSTGNPGARAEREILLNVRMATATKPSSTRK